MRENKQIFEISHQLFICFMILMVVCRITTILVAELARARPIMIRVEYAGISKWRIS